MLNDKKKINLYNLKTAKLIMTKF